MKTTIAAIFATALLFGASPALAHGGHSHGHGHGHGWAIGGALVGGVVLGHMLSQPRYPYYPYPPYPPGPPAAALGNCQPTTGVGFLNGRRAEFGGTMCYDAYGNGYVLPQSQRFIRYLP
jgi:hypothetical protein